uniref:Ribosomal protein S13 n=1 Tax=Labyrinthula sp. TaxID=1678526 RepID=A0A7S6ZP75_9STRA|nr:ribosomal protein S13 [Labyrinthula sp.]
MFGSRMVEGESVRKNVCRVYGVGRRRVESVCKEVGVMGSTKWERVTEKQRRVIEKHLEKGGKVGGEYRREQRR